MNTIQQSRRVGPGARQDVLMGLNAFMGVTALACGLVLATGQAENILQMNPDVLEGTPFSSFLIPGIILGLVVGGSQLLAAAALWRRDQAALRLALLAAIVLLGWIAVEVILLGWTSPKALQPFILSYSLIELALVAVALRTPARLS